MNIFIRPFLAHVSSFGSNHVTVWKNQHWGHTLLKILQDTDAIEMILKINFRLVIQGIAIGFGFLSLS